MELENSGPLSLFCPQIFQVILICEVSPPASGCKYAEGLGLLLLHRPFLKKFSETLPVPSTMSVGLVLGKLVRVGKRSSFPRVPFPALSCCLCEDLGLCGLGNLFIKGVKDFMYYPFRNI